MTGILTSRTRQRQPSSPVGVSAAAAGITGAFVAQHDGRLFDASGRSVGAQTYTGATRGTGVGGVAMSLAGTTGNGLQMPSGCVSMQSQKFSRIAVIQWSGAGNSAISDSTNVTYPASQGSAEWRIESTGSMLLIKSNIAVVGTSATGLVVSGRTQVVGVTYDGTSTVFWVNGQSYSGGSSSQTFTLSGLRVGCGNYYFDNFSGLIYAHLDWPMVLSSAQMREFTRNPWQLFAPVRRPAYFLGPSAGGSIYDVSLSEGASAADSVGAAGALAAALSEAGSAADVMAAAAAFAASMTEAATAGEAATATSVRAGALGESATAGDALAAAATLAGSIAESVTASDVISSAGAFLAALSEAASAVDAIDGAVGAATYSATLAEAASAGDAFSAAAVVGAAVVEAVTAGDTVASIAALAAAMTEAATAGDALTSSATVAAAISEAVTAADAWTGSVGAAVLTASLAEAVAVGDVFAALELLARFGVRGARGVSVQANARRAQLQRTARRN